MISTSTNLTDLPAGTFSLRPAAATDLDAIHALLRESELPIDGVAEALSDFVVAESDGRLVGVIGLEVCCDDALLRSAAVAREWRGRGLGRALVSRIIADAEARGTRALYLLTTTAEHYFPSFGFERTTRDRVPDAVRATGEFRSVCCASAIVMWKELAPATSPRAGT